MKSVIWVFSEGRFLLIAIDINPKLLLPHERTRKKRLAEIIAEIKSAGSIFPILIERENKVILDGHHRTKAAILLGIDKIPAYEIDYFSENVSVMPRRKNIEVSKEIVLKKAMAGQPFPPKTTRHLLAKNYVKMDFYDNC